MAMDPMVSFVSPLPVVSRSRPWVFDRGASRASRVHKRVLPPRHCRPSFAVPQAAFSGNDLSKPQDRSPPDVRAPRNDADNHVLTMQKHSLALLTGIKAVAVGKHGVKPVPVDVASDIMTALHWMHTSLPRTTAIENVQDNSVRQGGYDDNEVGFAGLLQALSGIHTLEARSSTSSAMATPASADMSEETSAQRALLLQRASLLGSLFVKAALSEHEAQLLQIAVDPSTASFSGIGRIRETNGMSCSAGQIVAYVVGGGSPRGDHDLLLLSEFALSLLNHEPLSVEQATELGKLLYSAENNTETTLQLKALIAHVMRIRHETSAELIGLTSSLPFVVNPAFMATSDSKNTWTAGVGEVALIAEPFDGVQTWDLLTPLLARHLRMTRNCGVVLSTGESSGPKYGPNLRDAAKLLGIPFASDADDLISHAKTSTYGVAIDQRDVSDGLGAWIQLRRSIVKRPGLATVEKYLDVVPGGASVFVASAFHDSYVEKMADVAEAQAYPAYIVVSRAAEGTLGFPLGGRRDTRILVGVRRAPGKEYIRTTLEFQPVQLGDSSDYAVPAKGSASAELAAERTKSFAEKGSSGDQGFDARVRATLRAFDAAFNVIDGYNAGDE